MKKNLSYLLAIVGAFTLYSCETEIKTNAEYKDITVVYGLLNPNESNHYIKITKAFLGEGNANDLANNSANFNYADGELDVRIDEYNANSTFVRSFSLSRTVNEIPKDDGVFSNTDNVLYKFVEPSLKKDYSYKLNIVNKTLGKEITSETKIANDPSLTNLNQITKLKLVNSSGSYLNHDFNIRTGANSGKIKVNLIFSYANHFTDTAIQPEVKTVKISLGEQKTTTTEGGDILVFTLNGANFFSALTNSISASVPNLNYRRINNCVLEVISAGVDLATYISVNEPSTSITQNKPEFTNLTNALGVFSSRNIKNIYTASSGFNATNPSTENLNGFDNDGQTNFDNDTKEKILTMGLNFCDPFNTSTYAPRCVDVISNWNTFNP